MTVAAETRVLSRCELRRMGRVGKGGYWDAFGFLALLLAESEIQWPAGGGPFARLAAALWWGGYATLFDRLTRVVFGLQPWEFCRRVYMDPAVDGWCAEIQRGFEV